MTVKLFDSHTHINYDDMGKEERERLIRYIEKSDVAAVVDVGFDAASSADSVERAAAIPWCFAAVGIHPHDSKSTTDADIVRIAELADSPEAVAIGEIGLDFFKDYSPRDRQRDIFKRLIALALKKKMPIIIHDRDSGGEAAEILSAEGAFSDERRACFAPNPVSGIPDARVLFHCYAGSVEDAFKYINMGASISIAGPVTYSKSEVLHDVARRIPLESMMIETDAPFLSPVPYRGKRNMSPYIEYTASAVADLRGISYEDLAAATFDNACRFFDIEQG